MSYNPDSIKDRDSLTRVASYNLIRDERGYWIVWGLKVGDAVTGPAARIPIADYPDDALPLGGCIPVDLIRTDQA